MTYARIIDGQITETGQPPRLYFDDTRWWDWRDDAVRVPATFAPFGWLPLVETPRPADTATTTYDYSVTLVAGVPTETWTERPKTQAEIDAATAAANEAQLEADTTADLTKLRAAIDSLALLLADEATVGSLRNIIGPSGAAAGTGSLRALKAQNNTAVVSAASIKGIIDRDIDAVQRQIDDAQATRRIARQTLRLAKAMVGDYSSADVGTE